MSDKIRNELTALGFEIKDTISSNQNNELIATFNASVYRKDIPLGFTL